MSRIVTDTGRAARALADGHVVSLPTETVYGLGALASEPHAIARVFATKGRPADHPLIVHVRSADAAKAWAREWPASADALTRAFWPGPLTVVVPRSARALDAITAGQDTVAVRVPRHPAFLAVLDALADLTGDAAVGIAAPSANRFGRVSPTTAQHVVDELGAFMHEGDLVLDGGASHVGVESTIVDCTAATPALLRPGAVTAADVEQVIGVAPTGTSTVRAPGTLDSHYAPHAQVMLVDAATVESLPDDDATSGVIALAGVPTPPCIVRLAAPAGADEYARTLYAALRQGDALGLARVLVVPPAGDGVALAVRDRLARAAHGSRPSS